MKSTLYLMSVLIFAGLTLMIWASYHALKATEAAAGKAPSPGVAPGAGKNGARPVAARPEVSRYVGLSYIGLTMFIIGSVGGIFAAFKAMTHRF